MKEFITLWRDKGHTRKRLPASVIADQMIWNEERLAGSAEYMVSINPTLRTISPGKKQFQASIRVSHRNLTYNGRVHRRVPGGNWEVLPDQNLGHTVIYGDIKNREDFNIYIYSSGHKPIQDWMLLEGYQVFIRAREEFRQIFLPDEENVNNT
jgi:hypothetical protein